MKNTTNKILLSSAAVMAVGAAQDAKAASTNLDITAEIRAAIVVATNTPLNFGIISQPAAGTGIAKIDTANVVANVSGQAAPAGGTPTSGVIDVTAIPNAALNITLPAAATLTQTNAPTTATMQVDTFRILLDAQAGGGTITPVGAGGDFTFTAGAAGLVPFTIGANINLASGQAADVYKGTAAVTVNYQ